MSGFQTDHALRRKSRHQTFHLPIFQTYHVIHGGQRGHHFGARADIEQGSRGRRERNQKHAAGQAFAHAPEFAHVRGKQNVKLAGDQGRRPVAARQGAGLFRRDDFGSSVH